MDTHKCNTSDYHYLSQRIAELEAKLSKKDEIIQYQDEQLSRKPCQYKRCIEFLKITEQRDRLATLLQEVLDGVTRFAEIERALASLDQNKE